MARILLGVSGGIAAYKALEFARLAIKAGHAVRVVQTEAAARFVGPLSFAAITGAPVLLTEWEPDPLRGAFPGDPAPAHAPLSHLQLVERADVFLVAPASANTIAKLAAGAADNLLCAAALACRRPLLVAPAMNDAMYGHPATRANLETLRARGVTVLDPGTGALGSLGEWGIGRLPEPPELLDAVQRALGAGTGSAAGAPGAVDAAEGDARAASSDRRDGALGRPSLTGARVLITAGGTREPIDAVRYVGNRSSGRMGFALAREAARRGADVTVVAANVALERDTGITYVDVGTAEQLERACLERFAGCDVLVMAAAVADFRPVSAHAGKLKKDTAPDGLRLDLERTPDVLARLSARRRPDQVLVGFAAEHGERTVEHARAKLAAKGLDAIVANDVSRPGIGFDAHENAVTIISRTREEHVEKAAKDQIAARVLDAVSGLRSSAQPSTA